MKTILFKFKSFVTLLLLMVTFAPSTVWADPNLSADGYYELATAEDLYWFAGQVNEGNTSINGRLTANITVNENVLKADGSLNEGTFKEWTPMGSKDNPYQGNFEGQGNSISGLYFIGESKVGLFSITNGATLSELSIKDSYFQAANYVGALAGEVNETTISLCSNASTIVVTNDNVGGLCGAASGSNFQNCYNSGLIVDKKCEEGGCYAYYGGIVGHCASNTRIVNCLNLNYTGKGEYAGPFTYIGGDYTITNSFYLASAPSGKSGKTSSQFASGQVCYLLNGMSQEGVWRQSSGEPFPSFVGDYTTFMPCVEHNYVDGVCSVCEMKLEPAFEDDYYLLSSVTDLKWFASEVNSGNNQINARLTSDITFNENVLKADGTLNDGSFEEWTPIGNYEYPFYGHFEGGAHTISGLVVNNNVGETLAGFFGIISEDASVNMLNVKDSYFSGGACGAIAAAAGGGASISYCANIGCTSIPIGDEYYNGGIVGVANSLKLEGCFSTGSAGNLFGGGSYVSLYNCYYLSEQTKVDGGMTEEYFKNGYVCYLLNNKETNSDDDYIVWRQNVGTDNYPVFAGPIVTGEGLACPHIFNEDYVCDICGEEKTLAVDEDGICRIRTAEELYLFARMVNRGNSTAKAKVMNDIVVNEGVLDADGNLNSGDFKTWTPIGNGSYNYYNSFSGLFDGQGYTISGLYCGNGYQGVGLFGYTGNAVIKNVKIVDSYFKGDSYVGGIVGCNRTGSDTTFVTDCSFTGTLNSQDNVGGICGRVYSNCKMKITNCNVYGNIITSKDYAYAGGVCGYVGAATVIANCNVFANINSRSDVGGICGYINSKSEISNCGFNGTISATSTIVGGIVGYQGTSGTTISGCTVSGTVKSTSSDVGGIVGYVSSSTTIRGCSVSGTLTISGYQAVGGIVGYVYASTAVSECSVSDNVTISGHDRVGGVVGYISSTTNVSNCNVNAMISGTADGVGGIAGYISSTSEISGCNVNGSVSGTGSSSKYVGGIVGFKGSSYRLTITDCQNSARVTSVTSVGGIVGWSEGYYSSSRIGTRITNCSNSGSVEATASASTNTYTGGIVGYNGSLYSTVFNCANTGSVTSSGYYAAGIVGCNNASLTIEKCYNSGKIQSYKKAAGICYNYSYGINVVNCYNSGTVKTTGYYSYTAGVLYNETTSYQATVKNCFNVGTVTPFSSGYGVQICDGYCSTSNSYYLSSTETTNGGRTAEQFADGNLCYTLNNSSQAASVAYRQGFDDKYPSFEGPIVTYERLHCTNHQYDEFGRCTICGAPKELFEIDGYCMIRNKADLYAFVQKVNKGAVNLKAKLDNDIVINDNVVDEDGNLLVGAFTAWKPVGTDSKPFKGEFDGQGHSISGLYFNNETTNYVGLFGYCNNASIKNVLVKDSYFKANTNIGALVGNSVASVISGCANANTTIIAKGNFAGGVVGFASTKTEIVNCYNTGSVTGIYVGGIAYSNYTNCVVSNCLNSGALNGDADQISYGVDTKKCYYLSDKDDFSGGKTEKQFRNGMVCWLLNNKASNENVIWRQKEGELYPSFEGEVVDYKPCTEHHFDENEVCTVCDAIWTPEQDGDFYLIGNLKELYWFNEIVNKHDQTISARVIDDIVVNENLVEGILNGKSTSDDIRYWKPLTGSGYFYRGTFDGGDHTISGIYVDTRERTSDLGFFGFCGGCTIKNVKLEDAFISGGGYTGGISAELKENGTIENCTFNGFFSTTGSSCGGIVGNVYQGTIKDCVNNATLYVSGQSAGVVGYASNGYIINCVNNGTIKSTSSENAGILGCGGYTSISNCKNTGSVVSSGSYLGGIAGYYFGSSSDNILDNCINEGSISGFGYSAGICGNFYGSSITNCTNLGNVNCTGYYVGGICGNFGDGYVSDCSNSGSIITTYEDRAYSYSSSYVGGIVGNYATTTIATNCHNTGYVEGRESYTGGLFGIYGGKQLTNSSNKGIVKGEQWTGGLAGNSYSATIIDCFNEGDVSSTNDYVGGLSGVSSGQIEKCYSVANVTSTGNYVGGLVGQYSDSNNSVKDSYCRGDVSVSNKDAYIGGLIGLKYGDTPGVIVNSYYAGKVSETSNSSIIANNCVTSKAYYLSEHSNPNGGRSATLFADGSVTVMLNDGREAENQVWFQNGSFPEFKGNAVDAGDHIYDNGFCLLHDGEYEQPKQNAEDLYYEIENAGQLYWFANKVNTGDSTISARVVKDIFVNGSVLSNIQNPSLKAWTPIGNFNNKYAGRFEGGKHTISGLYAKGNSPNQGLFGYSNGATISDIKVVDSYFNSSTSGVGAICGEALNTAFVGVSDSSLVEGCAYIGGICGEAKNSSFTDCVNKSPIKATCTSAAGICGQSVNTSYTKCKNYGDIEGCGAGAAGICALASGTELISDCENHGMVTNTTNSDGVAGICFSGCKAAENCLNTGDIIGLSSSGAAGICGNTCEVFKNCRNEGNVKSYYVAAAGICLGNAVVLDGCVNTGNISSTGYGNAVAGICITAADNATITNCHNEGNIDGRYSGGALSAAGICYEAKGAKISNCSNSGMIYGQQNGAAGITLYSRVASITDCENSGDISGYGSFGVSGICGNGAEVVANCTNKGTIKAEGLMSAVAGICYQTSGLDKFTNCHNEGVVDGRWLNGAVAGICAYSSSAEFDSCSNSANIYGAQSGVAGITLSAMTIKNSFNTGNIKANNAGMYAVGIVGEAGTVSNCHNEGIIDGRWSNGILAASGISYSVGQILDCSNTGNVYGSQGAAAGVCGSGSYIRNCSNSGDVYGYKSVATAGICSNTCSYVGKCYNSGNITSDSSAVAGILGRGDNCYIIDCYNLGKVKCRANDYKGNIYGGGICGLLSDSAIQSVYDADKAANVYVKKPCKQTITNCYSYDADCLNKICPDSSTVEVINCYYLANASNNDGGRPAAQFADGTVTALLNNGRTADDIVWFQNGDKPGFKISLPVEEPKNDELFIDDSAVTEVTSGTAKTVRYVRTNIVNNWGTLCLPFAYSAGNCSKGVSLFDMSFDNGELVLTQVNNVRAGQPVLFYMATPGDLEVKVSDTNINITSVPEENTLIGTFTKQQIPSTETNAYYIKGNKFWKGNGFKVQPFHAFFTGNEAELAPSSFRLALPEETELVEEQVEAGKQIQAIYNMSGQRVGRMNDKGVYVIIFDDGTSQKVRISE